MKPRGRRGEGWGWAAAVAFAACFAAFGWFHLSPWAAAWDEVDFALAVDRYDLLAMQPHAPGYPYFVLGGRLMRMLIGLDPVRALGLWSLLLACTSVWPLYAIARKLLRLSPWPACLAAAATLTVPMNLILAVRPMSDGAALALLWWYLWTLVRLANRRNISAWLAAAFVFGLLMGTRLSYAPFGLGLALVWIADWRNGPLGSRGWRLAAAAASVVGCQLLWLAAVAGAEGGWDGTLRLLASFGEGHFTDWGGGAGSSGVPLGERLLRFVSDNWLWTGLFAREIWLAAPVAAAAVWIALHAFGRRTAGGGWPSVRQAFRRMGRWLFTPAGVLTASAMAYAAWALLGQNLDKPRHAAPLAALTAFALAAALLTLTRPRARLAWLALALALTAAQAAEGVRLVRLQDGEEPAVYQLADALSAQGPDVLYTWEEERVLRYLRVPVETRPIFTYEYFAAQLEAEPNARIWLTGAVWDEFQRQAGLPDSRVRLLGTYRSDGRLDPVYGTIRLFEWIR